MGLIIGVVTGFMQYILLHKIVDRLTYSQENAGNALPLIAGKLILWAAVLMGVAFISLDDMLWAAGAMLCTSLALTLWSYFRTKKA
ncbi:MAG: hypothetical protein ACOYU3_11465 [Bacillota bacterium]